MARTDTIRPLIGVNAELKDNNGFDMLATGYKYVASVIEACNAIAVLVPTMGDAEHGGDYPVDNVIDRLDGMVLTGGRSNIEPHHYDGEPFRPETYRDPLRDSTTLPLARKAIECGLPIFGICRGIQEINVALGGSLHPYLWEIEGHNDHRMPQTDSMATRFGPRHPVILSEDGLFANIARRAGIEGREVTVNSLHGQGLNRVADGLVVEALSEDGVVEGVSMPDAPGFVIGVQWHAEYRTETHSFNRALFESFGNAARRRAADRAGADVA
ncbi:MAG: gamma-glutamyl-gamma-aminobutyrate hydrolase family protein [Alphaproteobacteria bacterium]|nr:gamma-glutamyl-gamma-aminobutyrate hydrolase family protein [Alphaproteobacteria bacterium]